MSSYNVKKAECEKRGIAFNFTEEQWKTLQNMKNGGRCAYTNHPFNPSSKKMRATVERIDESMPYEPKNCVLVTQLANNVKCNYIEQNQPVSKANAEEVHTLKQIQRVLADDKKVKSIIQTYIERYKGEVIETPMTDLEITKLYVKYATEAQRKGKHFEITIGDFKRTVSRKRCQVSKVLLPNMKQRVVRVIDDSKPITCDNIQVTSRQIDEIMTAIEEMDMTLAQKRAMMKSIGA
ncbi:hypothetical protein KVP40.0040 [Vibrio phage KVP40]|uniref:Uncharacterized protein n=3 Tax=Schizotequatrovirus KVP40 TaxID=1914019 RepID=Q6WIB1_BPKVM|nr:HNH endonuclease [Vibrio phage KVP40]QHJ74223.1 hypothetical protein VH12019_00304 [Vibrio phage VH1_2019]QIW90995.1 hypothetical protein COHAPHLL_00132 [Vibrio phage V09]UNA01936.1 hypothetical protein [Vibrio phage PC-Liy1]URQ03233.1 hypothetical protein PVA8_247 [Vibrio phage PVA8]WBM58968.1 hypothetical protein vBValMPVA8_246 [Vibrio phage vB_ValM_PVA8]WOL24951.1 hypothetical protein [Vibrio phage PG216]